MVLKAEVLSPYAPIYVVNRRRKYALYARAALKKGASESRATGFALLSRTSCSFLGRLFL